MVSPVKGTMNSERDRFVVFYHQDFWSTAPHSNHSSYGLLSLLRKRTPCSHNPGSRTILGPAGVLVTKLSGRVGDAAPMAEEPRDRALVLSCSGVQVGNAGPGR